MATILRRKRAKGVVYKAIVRRVGCKDKSKTFDTRLDAIKWSRRLERQIDLGELRDYSEASKLTLADIIKRYIAECKHLDKKDNISILNFLRKRIINFIEFAPALLKNNHKNYSYANIKKMYSSKSLNLYLVESFLYKKKIIIYTAHMKIRIIC